MIRKKEYQRVLARVRALEAALTPFALEATQWDKSASNRYHPGMTEPRQMQSYAKAVFTIGDLRRAARLTGIDYETGTTEAST